MTSGVSAGTLAPSSFCWPNLGCESPLVETPKGLLCWMGEPVWAGGLVGGTDCADCGRKVSTQTKYAFVGLFAGSDVRGKCKRITLTLSSVLTYRCMYVGLCIMGVGGQGASIPLSGEWGGSAPPPLWTSPSRRLHFIYFAFKSHPPL